MKEDGAFLLSLVVYAIVFTAYRSGVRFVPWKDRLVFRSFEGVCRYL